MGGRRYDERQEESRRILERVERDSQSLLSGPAGRARDHFTAREAKDEDWTELWGRRIGRALALAFALALIAWLVAYLVGGGS